MSDMELKLRLENKYKVKVKIHVDCSAVSIGEILVSKEYALTLV